MERFTKRIWKLAHNIYKVQKINREGIFLASTGRGRKGLGTTMHLAMTQNSFLNCRLFPGQRQDCKSVEQLWQDWPWEKINFVMADKGYSCTRQDLILQTGVNCQLNC